MANSLIEIKFTQSLVFHMRGSGYSTLGYEIYADGVKTNITRSVSTNGPPSYRKTADEFCCFDDTFDVLATKGDGLKAWLNAHAGS